MLSPWNRSYGALLVTSGSSLKASSSSFISNTATSYGGALTHNLCVDGTKR